MRIDSISLTNFRQYYGENNLSLPTNEKKNIVIIGGKNGFGKTNFLLSLVWCLYGEDMSKIDDNFRREIQKAGNYSKFLKASLNWDASKEGISKFSVQLDFSDIEIPRELRLHGYQDKSYCKVKREYNVAEGTDDLYITIDDSEQANLNSHEDKINFINDYLIPLDAAKFVFFDAEKIASWAELSTREEGSVFNDALSKILGLDSYEALIADLEIYSDGLRKDSATTVVKQKIITTENGIALNRDRIEDIENLLLSREGDIEKLKTEIFKYESFLAKYETGNPYINIEDMYKERIELRAKEKNLEEKFGEYTDILPFTLAAGKIEEVLEHIKAQESEALFQETISELNNKAEDFVEKLFNNPPIPLDGDISFGKKQFYAEKAKVIFQDLLKPANESLPELSFEHDLSKSEKDLIDQTLQFLKRQSKDVFEQVIDNFNKVKSDIIEIEKRIKKVESDLEDEEVIEYTNKKNELERKIEKLIEEKGSLQNQKSNYKSENDKLHQSLQILLKQISISEQKRLKFEKASLYIKALEEFVNDQKLEKCSIIETTIFNQLKKLMHKLSENENSNFIAAVRAESLPAKNGIKITLYNRWRSSR